MGGTPSNPPAIMAIPSGMRNRETDNRRFRGRFCARWIPLRFRLRIKDNLGRGSKHISLITASFLRISLKYHSPPEGVNSRDGERGTGGTGAGFLVDAAKQPTVYWESSLLEQSDVFLRKPIGKGCGSGSQRFRLVLLDFPDDPSRAGGAGRFCRCSSDLSSGLRCASATQPESGAGRLRAGGQAPPPESCRPQ